MRQGPNVEVGRLGRDAPTFTTERFVVAPLTPPEARKLVGVLLQDEKLADQLDWLQDKTAVGVLREAFLLELQCTAGTTRVWGIVERARGMLVGAVLARQTLSGIELEVLCASAFWQQGISDEVFDSASGWIADNMEMDLVVLQ